MENEASGQVDEGRETFPTVLAFEQPAAEPPAPEKPAEEAAKPTGFKESPEYKEIYEKATAAEQRAMRAEARADALAQARGEQRPSEEKVDFEDLSTLNPEQLREKWDTDPHAVLGNLLRQARHEVRQDLLGEFSHRSTRERQNIGLQTFAKENADFIADYQSGALNEVIEGNPIHSPVSAYLYRKLQNSVSKADHEKAVKDAEEKGRKEGQKSAAIREGARVLGPGPARSPSAYQDKKIKSEDYGGDPTRALLERHRARKQAAEG